MRAFPGVLAKLPTRTHPYVLSEEQEVWLREVFPVTENRKIVKAMGVSYPTLHRIAHQMGLKKDEEWMRAIRRQSCEEHKRMNRHVKFLLLSGQKPDRCTNLRLRPYTKRQIDIRCRALKRGYLLDEDASEGSAGRYAIYYDGETKRSEKFERTCQLHGLIIKKEL